MNIDSATYDKAKHYPQRHGYQLRGTSPTAIVIHSTSNTIKNTSFAAEAKYLFESADVSAHYLIGKDGRIVQFLEPAPWQAWHAGQAQEAYQNSRSIGIELHHSVGDAPYPQAQIAALTWLVRDLMGVFTIPASRVDTHRRIAIPGPDIRKHDPHDWTDAAFYAWRSALAGAPDARYRALAPVPVLEAPTAKGTIALAGEAVLFRDQEILVDTVSADGWAHIAKASPVLADVGFVMIGALTKV